MDTPLFFQKQPHPGQINFYEKVKKMSLALLCKTIRIVVLNPKKMAPMYFMGSWALTNVKRFCTLNMKLAWKIPKSVLICNIFVQYPWNIIQNNLQCVPKCAHFMPNVGRFFKIVKIQHFCCFITRLVKKLQQWSLYEVIEDTLPFVFNTKPPLSNIWLLS